jgi:DNA-binding CsgD family transcriptional regulator
MVLVGASGGGSKLTEDELVSIIYDAALHPDQWNDAMARVGEVIGATSSLMFSPQDADNSDSVLRFHNIDARMGPEFLSGWIHRDEWALAAARKGCLASGSVVTTPELLSQADFLKSAFYNDFTKKYDIATLMGSVLFGVNTPEGMPFTKLCWYRPDGYAHFSAEEREQVRRLVPHFQRALLLERKIREAESGISILSTVGAASIMLDDALRVQHCNAEALQLLGMSKAGSFRHDQLRHLGVKCSPTLQDAVARCARGVPADVMVLVSQPQRAVLKGRMIHIRPDDPHHRLGPVAVPSYALLVDLPLPGGASLARKVAGLFDLSPTEERVLGHLLDGATAAEAAQRTGTGLPTVRTHIQNILAKTGVTRQVDLIRTLCGFRY